MLPPALTPGLLPEPEDERERMEPEARRAIWWLAAIIIVAVPVLTGLCCERWGR